MCIAIYSLKGNPVPDKSTLKTCFENNGDGAGFAFNTDCGKVQIVKGFMTFNEFYAAFEKYEKKYGFTGRGVLIHFRIATHGGTNKGCCHPFPVTDSDKALKNTNVQAEYAVVHNGIIDLTSSEANKRKNMSDTMVFIEKYLSKLATNKGWFDNKQNIELVHSLIESKMAILDGYGSVRATSGFTKGDDGNYYSNGSYRKNYGLYGLGCYGYGLFDDYCGGYFLDDKTPLMELSNGETAILDDGYTEDYDATYHKRCPTYITEDGEIYCYCGEENPTRRIPFCDITYIGSGCFVSSRTLKPVSFRYDAYAINDGESTLEEDLL